MSKEHFATSARLLSMLGDRLIEDGKVALTELIKNGYDADAHQVIVDFQNFNDGNVFKQQSNSRIVIVDDGHGMTKSNIIESFLNIATSIKHDINGVRTSPHGRVYLGSHGIGRFSLLKLGKKINILTKAGDDSYYSLLWDFTMYNPDFIDHDQMSIMLDEIEVELINVDKLVFEQYNNNITGTTIIIEALNDNWDLEKVKAFAKNMTTFSPINLKEDVDMQNSDSFQVSILRDGKNFCYKENEQVIDINTYEINYLKSLIDTEAIYKIEDGHYSESSSTISFVLTRGANGREQKVKISINQFKDWESVRETENYKYLLDEVKCGDFEFNTYIFNFDKSIFKNFNKLTRDQVKFLKEYNIYLYRDKARVLPYGNEGIDWLDIDKLRAETRAGDYFSQGQLVGQIFITRAGNAAFQDKTSREGLIISGREFEKLKLIYRSVLEYIKVNYYDSDKLTEKLRIKAEEERSDIVSQDINRAIEDHRDEPKIVKLLSNIQNQYEKAKINYRQRLDVVEQLAGAGMSVEITSHELYSTLMKLGAKISKLQDALSLPPMLFNIDQAQKLNSDLVLLQNIAMQQLDNMQKILVSRKQRVRNINVNHEVKEIVDLYSDKFNEKNVSVILNNESSIIMAETIDAVIYQTLCNLIDNAIYWLDSDDIFNKKIIINFDTFNNKIIFADSGVGIKEDLRPFIFDAFFSGKGVKGRGLGLYISKRLLNKYNFDIRLAKSNEEILEGANFVIEFGDGR